MATVTVTSNTHNPLAPSWDQAIVPTLRKRLESESRALAQRLSTISVSTDDSKQQQPSQQQPQPEQTRSQSRTDTHDTQDTTSSSRRTPNGTRSHTPTSVYPSQRPSAIPRPSYSRTNERSNTSITRNDTSAPPAESSSLDGSQAATRRKRTQSTPFPFEPSSDPASMPSSSVPNGKQLSSSANSGPPTSKSSHSGRTTPTPSRIPTIPSRIRSGSQSSQGLGGTVGKSASTKIQVSETNPTNASESLSISVQVKSSSSIVSQQHASGDHQASRSNNLQERRGVDGSINERISSDEERPFQHWYRGDVSRNGGVGEYRVGKRMEMLDIASFGHTALGKTRRTKAPDGHVLPSTSQSREKSLRKRAESVSSIEHSSLYMEPPDDVTIERVLDETPLTDADSNIDRRPRRQSIASMERMSLSMEPSDLDKALDGPSGIERDMGHNGQNRWATKHPPSGDTKKNHLPVSEHNKHARPRNVSNPRHEAKASTSSTTSSFENASSRNGRPPRGRAQSPVERSRTPGKKVDQKRSKSAADVLRVPELSVPVEFTGLTDAVPDTRTPIPVDGNWDEMILPTVARRMGIEYEKTEPMPSKSPQAQIVPAPGTFGFDYSKYKPSQLSEEAIPMSEFGTRTPASQSREFDEEERSQQQSEHKEPGELPIDKPPQPLQQMRPRRDTLPPFAHYAEAPKEREDMPRVIAVQQETEMNPQSQTIAYVDEGEQSSCCKCIVM